MGRDNQWSVMNNYLYLLNRWGVSLQLIMFPSLSLCNNILLWLTVLFMDNWLLFHNKYLECCWLVCQTLSKDLQCVDFYMSSYLINFIFSQYLDCERSFLL